MLVGERVEESGNEGLAWLRMKGWQVLLERFLQVAVESCGIRTLQLYEGNTNTLSVGRAVARTAVSGHYHWQYELIN